ncbi:cytochrome-c peroxidase [Candidatus Entotheonella serta]|nr:cytochrome-c peroxidase [Candidatus Entotheonella serta]
MIKKTIAMISGIGIFMLALTTMSHTQTPAPLAALPEVPVPEDAPLTPDRVELGKLLYFDSRLSGDGSISCADCHDPKQGWGDGGDLSRGYPGTMHWRNSQTIVNSAYLTKGWFWTSSSPSLEKQANSAITGALAGNLKPILGEERLKQIPRYVELFKKVYGEAPTYDRALSAIAAYERTIVSDDSPFDQYMGGDKTALTEQQLRGKALFEGKAQCIVCHNGALMTDQAHYNLGVPPNPAFEEEPQRQIAMRERMRSKGFSEDVYLKLDRDPGRFRATKDMADIGKFRTPPLRYVKYTAPYMHNGVFFTLEEVVDVIICNRESSEIR